LGYKVDRTAFSNLEAPPTSQAVAGSVLRTIDLSSEIGQNVAGYGSHDRISL
jgi:hypothetical protein